MTSGASLIAQLVTDVVYLFMCLLATCMSSLEKSLLSYSAHHKMFVFEVT